jgi:TonB family protein
MVKKVVGGVTYFLVVCAACFGQSSFQEITPGTSTRNDVARVLGQPVRSISTTRFEDAPPARIAKVEVEYRAGSHIADRVEVYFVRPISLQALIQKLGLPPQADARKPNEEGRLADYFVGSLFLVLTYAAGDESSGISRIGYYSPELFASVVSLPPPKYPAIAKAARVAGTVTIQVVISEEGKATSPRAISGPPLLREACVEAAKNASFAPTLLNGKPAKVEGVIHYTFLVQ